MQWLSTNADNVEQSFVNASVAKKLVESAEWAGRPPYKYKGNYRGKACSIIAESSSARIELRAVGKFTAKQAETRTEMVQKGKIVPFAVGTVGSLGREHKDNPDLAFVPKKVWDHFQGLVILALLDCNVKLPEDVLKSIQNQSKRKINGELNLRDLK